jgi:hypothetical protein
MKQTITILLLFIFLFFSCATKEKHTSEQNFDMRIVPQKSDTSDLYYKDIKVWETWLNLSDSQKRGSDMEFRIWCSPELLTKKQLILFRRSKGTWKATSYSFDIRSAKLESSKDLIPKSEWENIENRFAALNIGQLPDDSSVPASLLYDDGISFIVEIADTKSYRYSKFSNPQQIAQQNKEASHWNAVLGFISQEFDISY